METENAIKTPLFYIEYYNPKTGKLSDISEEGYATLELCMAQIESENKEKFNFIEINRTYKTFVLTRKNRH